MLAHFQRGILTGHHKRFEKLVIVAQAVLFGYPHENITPHSSLNMCISGPSSILALYSDRTVG
jgi:hypothetical protein